MPERTLVRPGHFNLARVSLRPMGRLPRTARPPASPLRVSPQLAELLRRHPLSFEAMMPALHLPGTPEAEPAPTEAVVQAEGSPPNSGFTSHRHGDAAEQVLAAPHRYVCKLLIHDRRGLPHWGTGWLIGPRAVVTAGHCVYLHGAGGFAREIIVSPGLDGDLVPYGTFRSRNFETPAEWQDERDATYDYGAILLDQPVEADGFFHFGALPEGQLPWAHVAIAGYPSDRGGRTQYWQSGRAWKDEAPRRLAYRIDTFDGDSGAPIWLYDSEARAPVAIGLHCGGEDGFNVGLQIVDDMVENFRRWASA